jgi:alkylation response protein AidB-like acyl-CoA dehydrogenase
MTMRNAASWETAAEYYRNMKARRIWSGSTEIGLLLLNASGITA